MPRDLPLACDLDGDDRAQRGLDWTQLAEAVHGHQRLAEGFAVRYAASPATRDALPRLVAAERQCCGFARWDLEDAGHELILRVTGPADGVAQLAAAFGVDPTPP